jgi:hypothetical protein
MSLQNHTLQLGGHAETATPGRRTLTRATAPADSFGLPRKSSTSSCRNSPSELGTSRILFCEKSRRLMLRNSPRLSGNCSRPLLARDSVVSAVRRGLVCEIHSDRRHTHDCPTFSQNMFLHTNEPLDERSRVFTSSGSREACRNDRAIIVVAFPAAATLALPLSQSLPLSLGHSCFCSSATPGSHGSPALLLHRPRSSPKNIPWSDQARHPRAPLLLRFTAARVPVAKMTGWSLRIFSTTSY